MNHLCRIIFWKDYRIIFNLTKGAMENFGKVIFHSSSSFSPLLLNVCFYSSKWSFSTVSFFREHHFSIHCSKFWNSLKLYFSICHPKTGWLLLIDPLIFKRFIKDLTTMMLRTSVQPKVYNLFEASHMYVPGYTRDFVVHMV